MPGKIANLENPAIARLYGRYRLSLDLKSRVPTGTHSPPTYVQNCTCKEWNCKVYKMIKRLRYTAPSCHLALFAVNQTISWSTRISLTEGAPKKSLNERGEAALASAFATSDVLTVGLSLVAS